MVELTLLGFAFMANTAFAQSNNGSVGGIVQDSTKALIPGVAITLVNTGTGLTDSRLSNESGSYNFAGVPPGQYTISAGLQGFKTSVFNIPIGTSAQVRQDFVLEVGGENTKVEVSVTGNQLLRESSASVGEVLQDDRIKALPMVGNNVLDLLEVLPGFRASFFGQASDVIGGLNLNSINPTINGLNTLSSRDSATTSGYGVFSPTVINPDLVGEIRLILTPVDAELGRGNAQVQIQTRSGTNKFTGAAVWNIVNSALDANTWSNNRAVVNGVWSPTKPDWTNNNEMTASFGGPIVKNKTFFFALYDQNISNSRTLVSNNVLTDPARQGIVRYFTGWNPGNALTAIPLFPASATTGTYPAVDSAGNPLAPPVNPNNTLYTGELRCFSVFGNVKVDGSAFTSADCPGGTAAIGAAWDTFRPNFDSSGYIQKMRTAMPHANFFSQGTVAAGQVQTDGLNQAQFRWVRGRTGANSANAIAGAASSLGGDYQNRKQINIKIDQNINAKNRVSVGWSYQGDDAVANQAGWPNGFSGTLIRRPQFLTANGTSTLTPNLVNEARFGMTRVSADAVPAWLSSNSQVRSDAEAYLLQGGNNATNGSVYPVVPVPGAGNYQLANHLMTVSGATLTQTGESTPLYQYADTLSWTRSRHSFKVGVEVRFPSTSGYNLQPYPTVTGGATSNTTSAFTNLTNFTAANQLPGFLSTARTNAANMLYLLSGSIGSVSHPYWIDNASDVTNGTWQDTATRGERIRNQVMMDWDTFFKDDFKVTRYLTLNLGLRYEYYALPYLQSGFTSASVGQGVGLYGAGRPTSGNLFDKWLAPGNLFLTGYGSTATAPLTCANGVIQSPLLPVSTCDPNQLTTIEFIGPKSPNPNKTLFRRDQNNFGPAIGFAWQVPWFGEGKTTVRGGFQITYNGRTGNLDTVLGSAPGNTLTQGLTLTDPTIAGITATRSLNLSDVATLVPTPPSRVPGAAVPIAAQSIGFTAYAPEFATPYVENFTLSVTRSVRRNLTMDVRYIGTIAKKQQASLDLNTLTVFHNKELFDALVNTRAGLDDPLFDQMLAGLNINNTLAANSTTPLYGAVGTSVLQPAGSPLAGQTILQHGSAQLRRNTTFAANLANGNFEAVASSLASFAPTTGTGGAQALPAGVNPTQRLLRNGCDRLGNGLTNIATRCFSEDYLVANSQFSSATYNANLNLSNYQAMQAQFTYRPTQGISVQGTYTWSKIMFLNPFTDPLNRKADYGISPNTIPTEFKANGTFELPIGPNKLLLGNSSGWLGRVLERWQTSFTLNLPHGVNRTMNAHQSLYSGGTPDIVGPWNNPRGDAQWNGPNHATGTYFGYPSPYAVFPDPQCTNNVGVADSMGLNLQTNCTLNALALVVPAGTTGAILLPGGQYGLPLLQQAQPGTRGTLAPNTMHTVSRWDLNANASKTFRITESKSIQIRADANNVLNHPIMPDPSGLDGQNSFTSNFGQMIGVKGAGPRGHRTFQGQVRFSF